MKNKTSLSIAITTYNEGQNISRCLKSIQSLSTDIIIVDGSSTDDTVIIAKKYPHIKVISTTNKPNFHINKQMAIDACQHDWIFLLDADEEVSQSLFNEIKHFLEISPDQQNKLQQKILLSNPLFKRHQNILEDRDGLFGQNTAEFTAFFIPRLNYFLGKYLHYGGVYPDGQIRLFNKKYSHQPAKDVHEQIQTAGRVGWLSSDLYHYADPTFSRYLIRNNRYTSNIATKLQDHKLPLNTTTFINYFFVKPTVWFLLTYIRHKAILDGFPGFIFSWFSSLRFPIAYIKYYELIKTAQKISVKKDWD